MKLIYSIPGKFKVSILLTGMIGIILIKNLYERSLSKDIQSTFESLYKDRLIAESYILKLSEEFHGLKWIIKEKHNQSQKSINSKLKNIEQISLAYLDTKLTLKEQVHFENLENLTWEITKKVKNRENVDSLIENSLHELRILSEIQVNEARHLIIKTNKTFSSKQIQSHLEIALVIFVGLLTHSILFASKTIKVNPKAPSQLN